MLMSSVYSLRYWDLLRQKEFQSQGPVSQGRAWWMLQESLAAGPYDSKSRHLQLGNKLPYRDVSGRRSLLFCSLNT